MAKKIKKASTKKAPKKNGSDNEREKSGIRPLGDRILIRETTESKEQKTSSGIIIPITAQEDKGSKSGTVVAVGPGRTEDGKKIAPGVKIGDKVLFQWGDKVKIGDEEYYLVRENEVLAIIR